MKYGTMFVHAESQYMLNYSGDLTKKQARAECARLNFSLQVKSKHDALNYIKSEGKRMSKTSGDLIQIFDERPFGASHSIGSVIYSGADGTLWMIRHTSSDVPEWAVVIHRLQSPHNAQLAEILAAPMKKTVQQHDYPEGRTLDCGCIVYDGHEVMSASLGTACESCYDRMS